MIYKYTLLQYVFLYLIVCLLLTIAFLVKLGSYLWKIALLRMFMYQVPRASYGLRDVSSFAKKGMFLIIKRTTLSEAERLINEALAAPNTPKFVTVEPIKPEKPDAIPHVMELLRDKKACEDLVASNKSLRED
jgi:hypothetical protein